jgi:hypothetical protein
VESQSTLVWTKCGVVLHAETAVDLELTLVCLPYDTEVDDAFGDCYDLEGGLVFGVLLEESGVLEGGDKLYREGRLVLERDVGGREVWMFTFVGLLELGLGGKVRHV